MSLLNHRSFFLTSFLLLCAAAPLATAGCAAPTSSSESADSEEEIVETQDGLSAAGTQLVGSYWTARPLPDGFARLALGADGKYTASRDAGLAAFCITSPCLLPERGTWNAYKKASGALRVRIRPTGESSRWYAASNGATTLTLTRAGVTETLNKLATNECLDDADCKATEECGPKMCLMWCEVNDPFCCGTSTCHPKAAPPPPPPPACFGPWLDEFGGCRAANDGVLPDSCCVGLSTPCGENSCGVGKVCCNPLAGVCTNPGEFCIQ